MTHHIRFTISNLVGVSLLMMLTSFSISAAHADSITEIRFSHTSPTYFGNGQNLSISFNYSTTEAGGVRIFARPFTGGNLTADYSASGSPLYPAGSGAGTASFTISTGSQQIDQIRFQMLSSDQSQLLMEFFVDVSYHFGPHAINNIAITPDEFVSLTHGNQISISFDYTTTEVGGVRIFARPFTDDALTPAYGASGSPSYPAGAGSGTGNFTISSGTTQVDQIRFQMLNDDQSTLLLEFFIDVSYLFSEHAISDIVITPGNNAALGNGENINLSFDYHTTETNGVRIFARPFTNGALSPGYGASGSPLYAAGAGSGSGFFNFGSGTVIVDEIRFQMLNMDQTAILLEFFVPVHYLVSAHQIDNIDLSPQSPGYFTIGEQVDFTFDYSTSETGGVRIFGRPFTDGSITPNYSAHGSPSYPLGDGLGTGFFTITTTPASVDQLKFSMLNDDQSTTLLEYFIPVDYHFLALPSRVANEDDVLLPASYILKQNFPNPFNPSTTIPFVMPKAGHIKIAVYDLLGREVRVLADEVRTAGNHEISFQASDLPSGMYLYSLETGAEKLTKTLVLLK